MLPPSPRRIRLLYIIGAIVHSTSIRGEKKILFFEDFQRHLRTVCRATHIPIHPRHLNKEDAVAEDADSKGVV